MAGEDQVTVTDQVAELSAGLSRVLQGIYGHAVTTEGLTRLSGGASRETWAFSAIEADRSSHPLILRRDPVGAVPGRMALEARAMEAAGRAGVPVPALIVADDDPGLDGSAFLIMQRIDGETIPRRILRDDAYREARAALTAQCARAAAAIHSIDPRSVEGLDCGDQVAQFRMVLDEMDQPSPTFELAFRWLEAHRPVPGPRAVVHGDFRIGNFIVGPGGLRSVLDWELVHAGDPMEDLAWMCVKSWRFGQALPVGGFGTRDELISVYEEAGGRRVDRDALAWWEVLGNLKWGIMCMVQARSHTSGLVRSVELAAIGRRVCEVEWDLLEALGYRSSPSLGAVVAGQGGVGPADEEPILPRVSEPGDVQALKPVPGLHGGPGLHGVPSAAALVEAVREFVEGEVMGATDGRVSFHARVAGRVLAMVEREITLGPGQIKAHAQRLAGLGVPDDAELARSIRSSGLDERMPEVTDVVGASVRAKLEVAHPAYLDQPGG
ncbi:MAG: phosphotransferase family protein [Acidimicrobiales bacterium]